jgi:hypothetical protein
MLLLLLLRLFLLPILILLCTGVRAVPVSVPFRTDVNKRLRVALNISGCKQYYTQICIASYPDYLAPRQLPKETQTRGALRAKPGWYDKMQLYTKLELGRVCLASIDFSVIPGCWSCRVLAVMARTMTHTC